MLLIALFQGNTLLEDSDDVYGELLRWQAQMHTKSAGAISNFLDSNLQQLAKVTHI